MAESDSVYYLRARVLGASQQGAVAADFYLVAQDGTTAGAVAHDICRERGWVFDWYLALPQIPTNTNTESREAVARATKDGAAVVLGPLGEGEEE
jgi:hypothetical protein